MRTAVLAAGLAVVAGLAVAGPLVTSPRPEPRPVVVIQVPVVQAPVARPALQPAKPFILTVRPKAKPAGLVAVAANPQMVAAPPAPKLQPATMKGAVCKNPQIKGVALKPIQSRTKGCSIAAPVQVSSVSGVTLSPAAVINCDEAQALATWVVTGVQPAFNNAIVKMTVADSYSCRPRNNVRGAKVSEHGAGNAIDISAFVTKTGKTYTVASNYNSMIRAAQKAGCGIFHTILGPGSDGYHENHLHFDVAPYRGNPYCR